MNEKYELHPLTLAQSEFAAKNHDLVFQYLRSRNLPEDEFYGEVILGYLSAVQRYEEESWLRQYRFRSVAFAAMESAASSYRKNRAHQREREVSFEEAALWAA